MSPNPSDPLSWELQNAKKLFYFTRLLIFLDVHGFRDILPLPLRYLQYTNVKTYLAQEVQLRPDDVPQIFEKYFYWAVIMNAVFANRKISKKRINKENLTIFWRR